MSTDAGKGRVGGGVARRRKAASRTARRKVVLIAEPLTYFSQLDEDAFFWCLGKLRCRFKGVERRLLVGVSLAAPDATVRGLLGLFARYGMDTRQFAVFQDPVRRPWLTRTVLRSAGSRPSTPPQSEKRMPRVPPLPRPSRSRGDAPSRAIGDVRGAC